MKLGAKDTSGMERVSSDAGGEGFIGLDFKSGGWYHTYVIIIM